MYNKDTYNRHEQRKINDFEVTNDADEGPDGGRWALRSLQ